MDKRSERSSSSNHPSLQIEGVNKHHASKLILPSDVETPTAERQAALEIEKLFEELHRSTPRATTDYTSWQEFLEYDFVDEMKELTIEEVPTHSHAYMQRSKHGHLNQRVHAFAYMLRDT